MWWKWKKELKGNECKILKWIFFFCSNKILDSEDASRGVGMYQYFVKIVPTIYEGLGGRLINTNQFSVTEHFKGVPQDGSGHGLPGLFFLEQKKVF